METFVFKNWILPISYSCNNITTTLIQNFPPFLFWLFLQN